MTDLIVRGATVYDGTGAAGRVADVAVAGGRIEAVGSGVGERASRAIDGRDLALAPGFFDVHSHSDFTLPSYPHAVNSISQGVTTEILGNCGFSPAPLSPDPRRQGEYQVSCAGIGPDLEYRWSSFDEYLDALDAEQWPVNCAPMVGHNAVRSAVMGFEDRAPSTEELEAMRGLVDEALTGGAWGMSSGLIYAPGTYSEIDELAALGEVVAGAGAVYSSHVRNEGARLIDAVEEALDVGRRSGATVQVSHLKSTGVENYGLVHEAMSRLDAARRNGMRVFCDVYPYTAGSTFLAMLTPGWAQEGGFAELVRRLRSRNQRDRIAHEMRHGTHEWNSIYRAVGDWDGIVISSVSDRSLRQYEGVSIAELAARSGADPFEFTFDLLVEDEAGTAMLVFLMDRADVHAVLRYPYAVLGSDQLLVTGRERKVHPRCYGTYARTLGPLVRDHELFGLEEAVHKMTGLPASIFGLADRGRIAPGYVADLVLFDPATVTDRASYADPNAVAHGVEVVWLAGRVAYTGDGGPTDRLGRLLRRPAR